jgi:hypothetical protein
MPRHPPYALKHLNTQNDQTNRNREQETKKNPNPNKRIRVPHTVSRSEMLASTVQFSNNKQAHQPPTGYPTGDWSRDPEETTHHLLDEEEGEGSVPSGPNSVSNPMPSALSVPYLPGSEPGRSYWEMFRVASC